METTQVRKAGPRSVGPFVTASGRRLPVRTMSYSDLPGLIEFSDYLARRKDAPEVAGFDRAALERMTEEEFRSHTVIAIMAGPRFLIRGVGEYERTSAGRANVRFTVDDSLLADGAFCEMVYRVADDAREHEVTELRPMGAGERAELAAFEATGFPIVAVGAGSGGFVIDIAEPR